MSLKVQKRTIGQPMVNIDWHALEQRCRNQGIRIIAGVDEAGRGPLAGPVVAAAVVFDTATRIEGVNDSKKLSERQRSFLFDEILLGAVDVGVGIVAHDEIDRINILQASILAMRKAVDELRVIPEVILADGNSFSHEAIRVENVIGGDGKCFSVAAASIVAKVTRDRIMREYHLLFPDYGFERHKGYGTPEHLAAIRRHGLCRIHRRSFRCGSPSGGSDER